MTTICNDETKSNSDCRNLKKTQNLSRKCEICEDLFSHKKYYERHMKTEHGKTHQCELCQEQFTHEYMYIKHMKVCGTSVAHKVYPCIELGCIKEFKTKRYMKDHYQRAHLGIKYRCKTCKKEFSHRSTLYRHGKSCQFLLHCP